MSKLNVVVKELIDNLRTECTEALKQNTDENVTISIQCINHMKNLCEISHKACVKLYGQLHNSTSKPE